MQVLILKRCWLWLSVPCAWDWSLVALAKGTIRASVGGCFWGQITEPAAWSSVDTAEWAFRSDSFSWPLDEPHSPTIPWLLGWCIRSPSADWGLAMPGHREVTKEIPVRRSSPFVFTARWKELMSFALESLRLLQTHSTFALLQKMCPQQMPEAEDREPERSQPVRRIAYCFFSYVTNQ